MNYQIYIKPELLILIPVLYLIGIGLKQSRIRNSYIPIILGGIAVLLSSIWVLATAEIGSRQELADATFTALTQGVLLAGASVYANQLYLQTSKRRSEDRRAAQWREEIENYPLQDTFNCDDMTVSAAAEEEEEENCDVLCDENKQAGSGK